MIAGGLMPTNGEQATKSLYSRMRYKYSRRMMLWQDHMFQNSHASFKLNLRCEIESACTHCFNA